MVPLGEIAQYVVIGDSGALPDRSFVNVTPIASNENQWTNESGYPELSDATWLAKNLDTTLGFYHRSFGMRSWDDQGSAFHAGIRGRGRSSTDRPDTNAYGANGYMLIGDGRTSTGQAVSEALDIVSHEFTHSVISASADFFYEREAGAINESLADFIGMTVAGHTTTQMGAAAGWAVRDLAQPMLFNQPELYGDYQDLPLDTDYGGVHRNSGILNRALYRTARRISAETTEGALPLSQLLLDSLRDFSWSPQLLMEDFAVGLQVLCEHRAQAACSALASELEASELLSPAL